MMQDSLEMGIQEPVNHFMKTIHKAKVLHKVLLAALSLLTFSLEGHSQEKGMFKIHEISVGYAPIPVYAGLLSPCDGEIGDYEDITGSIYGKQYGSVHNYPYLTLSYNHFIKKWFSIDTRVSLGGYYYYVNTGRDTHVEHFDFNPYISVTGMARFSYLNKPAVRLYSSVGVGLVANSDLLPTIQLTYFGVSFGKRLFGFVELGAGLEYLGGMCGLGYRF